MAASGVAIAWERHEAGLAVLERRGTPLPDEVVASVRATKVAIKGPITTPVGSGFRSVNVALRKALDLYACLRPAKSLVGVPSRYAGIDLVVVRENTEDLYAGIEHQLTPDVAESIKVITRRGSERIVRYAFDYARAHGRHKVTAVHKANIMKLTDGLFLRVAREVAVSYPDIAFDDCIVDNLCQQLVLAPGAVRRARGAQPLRRHRERPLRRPRRRPRRRAGGQHRRRGRGLRGRARQRTRHRRQGHRQPDGLPAVGRAHARAPRRDRGRRARLRRRGRA